MSERTRHAAELAARLERSQWHPFWNTGDHERAVELNPYRIAADTDKLMRLEASLRGIAVQECNGRLDLTGDEEGETPSKGWNRRARLENAVTEILAAYGLKWEPNRDPRGSAVYIHFSDGAYNTMGGRETGWGV